MQTQRRARKIRGIFAFLMLFAVGQGCVAIYGFDEFDKEPPPNCETTAACPGSDLCAKRSCEQKKCKLAELVPEGTIVGKTETGDCLHLICDGEGNAKIVPDNSDVPIDDDACSVAKCSDGTLTREVAPEGTACGTGVTTTCNKAGACSNCENHSDCGVSTPCAKWLCENKICVKTYELLGTIADDPMIGDCRKTTCDGAGNEQETIVVTDVPPDGNDCTTDTCTEEGIAAYPAGNIGLPCGTCGLCMPEGLCGPCDLTQFDCVQGQCIPKPKPCTTDGDCQGQSCVDGFCCNSPCSGQCMACNESKTGQPSGICAPITNGTDPENECENMAGDVCWDGGCRCTNQVQDGPETGTDCGGNCMPCTGTWDCGGAEVCNGNVTPECCWFNEALCDKCTNAKQTCQSLQGSTCVKGSPSQLVTLGVAWDWGCFDTACRYTTCACK